MDLQAILEKHMRGETLTQAEMDYLTKNQGGDGTLDAAIKTEEGRISSGENAVQNLTKNSQVANINVDDYLNKAMGGNDLVFGDPNISKQRPNAGMNAGFIDKIEPKPVKPFETTVNPDQPKKIDGVGYHSFEDAFPKKSYDPMKLSSSPYGISGEAGGGEFEDQLSKGAQLANFAGAGMDLESSLYTLGQGIGEKNTGKTIGSAGKAVLAGSRSFLSGLSHAKRGEYVDEYYEDQMRKGIVGRSREVSQANDDRGGSWVSAEDGGTFSAKEKAFVTELAQYMNGGKTKGKINLSYEDGGNTQSGYSAGDKITFKDSKGKVISGVIKGFKDGEIILED